MKKRIFLMLVFAMLVAVPLKSFLYAEEARDMGMMEEMKEGKSKGMMGGKMMGMHMMMKMMMEKSVTPTSDGGIVIVAGNKITKYDKNLNLIKEAELKMDMETMGKNMKEMMAQCPMMKDEMKKMDSKSEGTSERSAQKTASSSDHEQHH